MKYASDKLVPVEPADITTPEGNLRRYRQERATPAADIPPAGPGHDPSPELPTARAGSTPADRALSARLLSLSILEPPAR